ncbi:MAG TPA: phosphoglucosamine mutase [Fibrobacteria bacterium]|nr:phosphoglucosamine mutase [Fibrobacteria bacterium]
MAPILMRSVSGVRGIVGDGLTPTSLAVHVNAFVQEVGRGRILVGRDARDSGPLVEDLVCATLALSGCTAVKLGISSTPTVEMAVLADPEAVGGIILTASHNPAQWNALKFLDKNGLFLGPDSVRSLFDRVDRDDLRWVPHTEMGRVIQGQDADDLHIDAILKLPEIALPTISKRKPKVVVDCVNGATYRIAPRMLERMGCEVQVIHATPDGTFPRGAEPVPEALADLGLAVRNFGADLGLAFDPDGDRLALVDELGTPLGEEATLALGVRHILAKRPGGVAVNLSTSRMSEDLAQAAGVPFQRTPVGEIHVAKAMLAANDVVGGEGNGGLILPHLHPGRDGLLAAAVVLSLLSESGRKLSELAATLPRYAMVKTKFGLEGKSLPAAIAALETRFADAQKDVRDGLRLSWPDSWLHVRASNTEPILRAIAEAPTEERARELCEAAREVL